MEIPKRIKHKVALQIKWQPYLPLYAPNKFQFNINLSVKYENIKVNMDEHFIKLKGGKPSLLSELSLWTFSDHRKVWPEHYREH